MASSNKTPNYNLPQYAEDDTIEFTPEINTAFSTIDAAIKANATNIGLLNNGTLPLRVKLEKSGSQGRAELEKKSSSSVDYGTELTDFRDDGTYMKLILSGNRIIARMRKIDGTTSDITLASF